MAERTAEDVKLRPIPGDVLRKRNVDYTAIDPQSCFVITERKYGRNGVRHDGYSRISDWRKWAATAEVIHIAQPAGTAGEEA